MLSLLRFRVFVFALLLQMISAQVSAQITVTGKVADKEVGNALEGVNILFKSIPGNKELGTVTAAGGAFSIKIPSAGTYSVRYSYLGYKTKKDTISLSADLHLGTVKMKLDKKELNPVDIETEKTVFDEGSDKLSYSPDEKQMQSGASVLEFLQTVPSVSVNMKGKITLRGSSKITVMIDGKLSGVTTSNVQAILENLPLASIERIEIYDNPTAKMNAQGAGGIINIVTKKGENEGFNGSVSLAVGIREKANGNIYLAYKKKSVSVYGTYGYRYGLFASTSRDTGINRIPGVSEWNFERRFDGRDIKGSHTATFGLEWAPDVFNTISLTGFTSFVYGVSNTTGYFTQQFDEQPPFDAFRRDVGQRNNELNAETGLYWVRKFRKPKQVLEAEITYGYGNQAQKSDLSRNRNQDIDLRYTDRRQTLQFVSARTDFTLPISKGMKFETGARYSGRFINNEFNAKRRENDFGFWLPDSFLINKFSYAEHIAAFYGEFTHKINKWKYRVGFRGEPTFINTALTDGSFSDSRFYFGWFPFAGIYRDITKTWETKITYARRISRPKAGALNPFTDFSDPLDLRFGNPGLNPEFQNTIEWATQYKKGDYLFKGAVFGRFIENPYGRIRYLDSGSVVITSTLNYRSERQAGLELIGSAKIAKALTLSGNVNLYYTHIDASDIQPGLKNSLFGYQAKLTAAWFLPKIVSGYCVFNYRGPDILVQGKTFDTWRVDLGIRRSFLKNKLTLTFSVNDVFNTWFDYRLVQTPDIERYTVNKAETRIIMAGLIFKFGKNKNQINNNNVPDIPDPDNNEQEE